MKTKPVAILTDIRNAISYRNIAYNIAKVLKDKGVHVTVQDWTDPDVSPKQLLITGTFFQNNIAYLLRFAGKKIVYYADCSGPPMVDAATKKISERLTIIANSKFTKENLESVGVHCDGVIPHAIDMKSLVGTDKTFHEELKSLVGEDKKIALTSSTNHYFKGLENLLVAAKLYETVCEEGFVILHSGQGEYDLNAMQNLFSLKRFWSTNCYGFLTPPQMNALHTLSSFYVMPSFTEGFGMPIIESFRVGKPVIAADMPPINELVKHNYTGFLIPVERTQPFQFRGRFNMKLHFYDVDALASCMIRMTEPQLYQGLVDEIWKEREKWDMYKIYPDFLKYFG